MGICENISNKKEGMENNNNYGIKYQKMNQKK